LRKAMSTTLWLDDITSEVGARVGGKALNLGEMKRAGFPVPDGFCVTVQAYVDFVAANGLEPAIRSLQGAPDPDRSAAALRLQEAIHTGQMTPDARDAILSAYRELTACSGTAVSPVAVRSSATVEDLAAASSAGQQSTFLNVRDEGHLLQAVVECWASLWSPRAVIYRARQGAQQALAMAVVVQRMVDAESAGVAFSQDPVTGEATVVIEAALGLGEAVVGGDSDVDRYTVSKASGQEVGPAVVARKPHKWGMAAGGGLQRIELPEDAQNVRVLATEGVKQIGRAVLALEQHFGCPQDMEWAWAEGKLYILQSRPVTTGADRFFTEVLPGDDRIWSSGFLNERFPLPVSPLGWTLINDLLERLAFRDPLRYLGLKGVDTLRISKLYRGHPYVNLFVFQTLYKVFPGWLLPEDSYRYFPSGKTELRRAVNYPRSLFDPRFLLSMVRHFLRQPALWSPWHNYRVWAAFTARHNRCSQELEPGYELLAAGSTVQQIWSTITRAQDLNAELLSIHRWSLTCADLTYSLLRRLAGAWVKEENAIELCAHLVVGLPNKSVEMERALHGLAQQRGDEPAFAGALQAFLKQYGHRSYYLDIYHPSFSDEPAQVFDLLERVSSQVARPWDQRASVGEEAQRTLQQALNCGAWGWLKRAILGHVLHLARCYMPLREDQRFYWQRTLALQRKLFLLLGKHMAQSGELREQAHIFFLTAGELRAYVQGEAGGTEHRFVELAASRQQEFARLQREFETAPERAYPSFLQGNQPLVTEGTQSGARLRGRAVSPGLAQGRVVVLRSPAEFGKVMPGDVLVAAGVDPGWTVIFGLLSALVLEHGGQLSHAAVVAREYGLPAVAGIPGVADLLHDGDRVLVDGLNGWVSRVA